MTTDTRCPDTDRLAMHARTDLRREDAAGLDFHLAHCRSCLDHYVELGRRSVFPRVPGCHIVKEIGRGRFGVVYKAWWLQDSPRIVALKVLSSSGKMERGRFDREIAVLRKIDSPWIVKLLHSGEADDVRFYVMDFVEGEHLDKYMGSPHRSLVEKLTSFEHVCRAVADAHASGVVHRDLKPQNILIDAKGDPQILDFGICSVESQDWSGVGSFDVGSTLTHPGDVIGTLKYMSPEQAWGGVAGAVDERSDIWSLGIMLHEIVTAGGYPYPLDATPEKSAPEALLERIRKELPRIEKVSGLPRGRDIETLLHRCLAWERGQRIASAGLLADELSRYCRGDSIVSKPLSVGHRLKRLAVGAAAQSRAMFMVLFVGFVGATIWLSTLLFDVGWMVTGQTYSGQTAAPVPSTMLADAPHGGVILIAGVSDATVPAVIDYAKENGFEGVTQDLRTWRAVYGHLMSTFASLDAESATPRAVVWDFFFRTPQSGDPQLVEGIESLERTGTPVTLASEHFHADGSPELSPYLVEAMGRELRVGAIVARDMTQRSGEFVMAFRNAASDSFRAGASTTDLTEASAVIPSLALVTLAALLHPNTSLEVDWRGRNRRLELLYAISPRAYLRERDHIGVTKVFKTAAPSTLINTGNLLACSTFSLRAPPHWQERTVPFEDLLLASRMELADLVNGKLIIFGDLRLPRLGFAADRHRVKYGSTVVDDTPGCHLMADLVSGLLSRQYIKSAFLLPPAVFVTLLLLAVVGALAPLRLGNKGVFERAFNRRMLWMSLGGLSMVAYGAMLVSRDSVIVHGGMVGFAILLPMAGSFWVEFTRNRHRILERNRRACLSLSAGSDGTITLASRPRKS